MICLANLFHHTLIPAAAAAAKSHQSCLTLCDPIDDSPIGSSVPGILQARTLEWVAISFSKEKHLLISWLQSQSAVILEPKTIV